MFKCAHRTNSKVMFVLSAGSRLLSQREPQSLPVDALSFVGTFSLPPFFPSFFLLHLFWTSRVINSELILGIALP